MTKRILLTVLSLVLIAALSGCTERQYVHVGPNWEALYQLEPAADGFEVKVSAVKATYRLGETLSFDVTSAESGRLWVFNVNPDDEVSQLFPNAHDADNLIEANRRVQIPGEGAKWSIEVSEPEGDSIVGFIVTQGDLDLDEVLKGRDERPVAKALSLVTETDTWGLAKRVVTAQP